MRSLLVLFAAWSLAAASLAQDWAPVPGRLMTRWAKDVNPDRPWPEYPRPTMTRDRWLNLNGLWEYAIGPSEAEDQADDAGKWPRGRILVPFSPESSLSGVGKILQPDQTLVYTRAFRVPEGWGIGAKGQRLLLHFGAVDWHARVRVNGIPVGEHSGGYDAFSIDITSAARPGADNTLEVRVRDGTNQSGQPRGKQWLKPHGIWYTPTSGIWQTVWLEPVPARSIASVRTEPNAASGAVRVHVKDSAEDPNQFLVYEAEVSRNGLRIAVARSPVSPVDLKIPGPDRWSPDNPALYDLTVRTLLADKPVDEVKSYFAFRDVALANDSAGVHRLFLNGRPLFMFGPLDQGFWPDGIYTPPTEEAMRFDIEAVKRMGGNMLRKHVKVESERFYTLCDQLGMMVWQDMPSPFFADKAGGDGSPPLTDESKQIFERELSALVQARGVHPSIVMWVPFNEGWGQNDLAWSKSVVDQVKARDPTRLVNCASGWTDTGNGDVLDIHVYPGPGSAALQKDRAVVLGEYGGLGLPLPGHTWVEKDNWGYVSYKSKEELTDAYVDQLRRMPLLIGEGLAAAVYTQTTDVEIECNGWLTYDREVWKIDPDRAALAAKALYQPPPTVRIVVPRAGQAEGKPDPEWWHTLESPSGDGWRLSPWTPDTAVWKPGKAGFGSPGTPGAVIGTEWTSPEIWLRREATPAGPLSNPFLSIHHDEDAEVYLNGELAATLKGYTTGYTLVPVSPKAAAAIRASEKLTIAVHCRQTRGGQYIDVGIVDVAPSGAPGK